MKLYHGSLVPVEQPKILPREAGKTCDFGIGFYTTTKREQAERWVIIKAKQKAGAEKKGFVSEYEAANNILRDKLLKTLIFKKADKTWLEFVIKNRKNPEKGTGKGKRKGHVTL